METSYDLAKKILGDDFISPEEIMKSCKEIIYTDLQVSYFGKTVPVKEILEWCRDNNFILVAGPNRPMSLIEIRTMKNGYFYSKEGLWYDYQAQLYAKNDKVETRWYMICKDIIPESTSKNWDEQHALVSEIETVPNAPEFFWAIITYKTVRGIDLFLNEICARTSSIVPSDIHAYIGRCGNKVLRISNDSDSNRDSNLGLSVARKNDN